MNDTSTPESGRDGSAGPFANLGQTQQPNPEPPPQASDVGTLLCATRMRIGKDLQDVAAVLHIRYNFLVAIEDGRYEDLPGQAYAIGFVRAYADHLGLDGDEVVRRYKEETAGIKRVTRYEYPIPPPESGIPSGALLLIAVVLGMMVYGVWYTMADADRRAADVIQEVPDRLAALLRDDTATTPAPEQQASDAGVTEEAPPPPEAEDQPVAEAMAPEAPASATPAQQASPVVAVTPPTVTTLPPTAPAASTMPPVSAPPVSTPSVAAAPASTTPAPKPTVATPPATTVASAPQAQQTAPAVTSSTPATAKPEVAKAPVTATTATVETPPPAAAPVVQTPPPAKTQPAPAVATAPPAPVTAAPAKPATSTPAPTASVPPTTMPTTQAATQTAAVPTQAPKVTQPAPAASTPTATTSASVSPATTTAAVAPVPPKSTKPAATSGKNANVELRAKSDSWIQVRDGEQLLLTRFLRKGEAYKVPDRTGLTLMTLNAGGVEIIVDGAVMPPLGDQGSVARGVSLDGDKLKAQAKPAPAASAPARQEAPAAND